MVYVAAPASLVTPSAPTAGQLWAVTSYFNPCGYVRRRANYRAFRRCLQVPLITVELGHRPQFELSEADADILIQVRDGDVMWQKERLLNLAIAALPGECDAVAWLDCDIVFDRREWAEGALAALRDVPLVQPFARVFDLPAGRSNGGPYSAGSAPARDAVARRWLDGTLPDEFFGGRGYSIKHGFTPGHAWVARRDLVERHGIYDRLILGGGDKFLFSTALGRQRDTARAFRMTEPQIDHGFAWADAFRRDVKGRISHLHGDLFHLWHGDLAHRGYRNRHDALRNGAFDPQKDLALGSEGAWRWNSDKPGLHDDVAAYFAARQEDGMTSEGFGPADYARRRRLG